MDKETLAKFTGCYTKWDMEKSEIMKRFYAWLDEKYGDAHPHRYHMKMAWMEAFKQGMELASQPADSVGQSKTCPDCGNAKDVDIYCNHEFHQ